MALHGTADSSAPPRRTATERPDPVQAAEKLLVHGEPDWAQLPFDLHCARCGYNLRLLTQPRCPECGLEFDWRAVLVARLDPSTFLFEHQWRKCPVRSWLLTVWRALRPWRFWRLVSIHQEVRFAPLLVMFLTAVPAFMLTLHGGAALLAGLCAAVRHAFTYPPFWFVQAQPDFEELARVPSEPGYWHVPGFVFLVLAGATGLLCLLQQTIARCRVRTAQVFRVAAYSAPVIAVFWAVLALAVAVALQVTHSRLVLNVVVALALSLAGVAAVLALACGLGPRYLRLPRAWLLAVTAVGVGVLFAGAVFALTEGLY